MEPKTEVQEPVATAQPAVSKPEAKVPEQPVETQEQIHWKKFREQREEDRRRAMESEKKANEKAAEAEALKAAMEAILNKPQRQEATEESEIDEDTKIQRKVEAAISKKEKEYEKQRLEREQREMPQKLASIHKDFHQVCSAENIDYIEFHYPEIARAFKGQPDTIEKWSDIYNTVKRFVPNPGSEKDAKKAEKNMAKPQSMSVAGVTQTGDTAPIRMDEQKRKDNWTRMQRVMKGGK